MTIEPLKYCITILLDEDILMVIQYICTIVVDITTFLFYLCKGLGLVPLKWSTVREGVVHPFHHLFFHFSVCSRLCFFRIPRTRRECWIASAVSSTRRKGRAEAASIRTPPSMQVPLVPRHPPCLHTRPNLNRKMG